MDAVTTTDEGNKIARLKSLLVHMVFDCLNWVGKTERVVLAFPCLDQRHQYIQAIALRRAIFRLYAYLKCHLAEEQLYIDLIGRGVTPEASEALASAMEHAEKAQF